uniref:Uncharacterized protein n=1 Tax=Avena sativa TaxID=4498 RepID=A0ACD5TR22_AVESA
MPRYRSDGNQCWTPIPSAIGASPDSRSEQKGSKKPGAAMMDGTIMDRDWTALPEDILLIAMAAMEVPDIVRSGVVCSSWRTAYALFRRLRLQTPKQPPCLLYACEDYGADAAALYSPSSSTAFRVPFPGGVLPRHSIHGSAHGWLFILDEAVNPYLLNPLTGARATLPPSSTLRRVTGSFLDAAADGGTTYAIDFGWSGVSDVRRANAREAVRCLYDHVTISSVGEEGGACVVLLMHTFYAELSFARTGDDRWISLSSGLDVEPRVVCFPDHHFVGAAHNDSDGLFYLIGDAGGVYALDLNLQCPVSRPLALEMEDAPGPSETHYLVFNRSGDLLLVSRLCKCVQTRAPDTISSNGVRRKGPARQHSNATVEIGVYKVDIEKKRLVKLLTGVGDNAIFLGHNSPLCLPICEYPMLTRNCAYLTTDNDDILAPPVRREDIGIWDLESQSMQNLRQAWPLRPWLHTPAPVWITPSLY